MHSLYKINSSPVVFIALALLVRVVVPDMSWLSFGAVLVSLFQLLLLFNSIGAVIPIRYLLGFFMCVQMLVGPILAYNGLDQYQFQAYKMQVSETIYFSYALPAVIAFIVGLHIRAGDLKGEKADLDRIKSFVVDHPTLPYVLIAVGFVSSFMATAISSELSFVFYLIGSFKFIGAFLLILGNIKIKVVPLILVFGSIISSSLGDAMFHDLLIWIIFTGLVVALKVKPGVSFKIMVTVAFVLLAVVIQQLKGSYRMARARGQETGLSTYVDLFNQQKSKGIFSFEQLAASNVRINQGFIISYVMKTVPERVPFSQGNELIQILEAGFLPRILAPNKLVAGDRTLFNRYTGLNVQEGTTMGIGSLGDGYLNFGVLGGIIFMFVFGLFFNEVLLGFNKISAIFPIAILFTASVFYHPIRPDNELQTILGHLVKSCIILGALYLATRKSLIAENSDESHVQMEN